MLKRIEIICNHLDISIEELALRIDVDPGIFQLYEDNILEMDNDTLHKICDLGGFSPRWVKYGQAHSVDILPLRGAKA